jgi:PAS domain S-box-containing protein
MQELTSYTASHQACLVPCADLLVVAADTPLVELLPAIVEALQRGESSFYGAAVVAESLFVGLITRRNLLQFLIYSQSLKNLVAKDLVSHPPVWISAAAIANPYQVLELMAQHHTAWVAVEDEAKTWLGILPRKKLQQTFWQPQLLALRRVTDVINTKVIPLSAATSLQYAAEQLLNFLPDNLVIAAMERVVHPLQRQIPPMGYISVLELLQAYLGGKNFTETLVQDWLVQRLVMVPSSVSLLEVAAQMQREQVSQIWIIDGKNNWLGMISEQSLLDLMDPIALHWQRAELEERLGKLERTVTQRSHPKIVHSLNQMVRRSPYRVLLIEPLNQESELLARLLAPPENFELTFQVIQVDSIAAAIAQLENEHFDLILVDLNLQDTQGFTSFEPLQPYVQRLPIILLVEDEGLQEGVVQTCLEQGAQDYLLTSLCNGTSAVEQELLMRSIAYAIDHHGIQNRFQQQQKQLSGQNQQLKLQIKVQSELVERLRNTDAQVRVIFEAIADIILVIEPISWHISNIATQPTHAQTQYIQATIQHLEEHQEQYQALVHQAIAEGVELQHEYSLLIPTEQSFIPLWFSAKICPTSEHQIVWVAHDITPIKQAQQELFLYQQELEAKVQSRTQQLQTVNQTLTEEIKQRKLIAAELRQERNFLSAVFNLAGALLLVLDQHGRILRFNPASEQLTGYHADDVIGKHVWELFLRAEDTIAMMQEVRRLLSEKTPGTQELDWRSKYGRVHRINWTHTVLLNDQGDAHLIISVGIDVSDRLSLERTLKVLNQELEKRVQERTLELEQIQFNQRQLLAAVDAAVEAIAIFQDDQFVSVNPAFLDLFGYPHLLSLNNHSWHDLFDQSEQERIHLEILPQLQLHQSWQGEAIAQRQDHSTFIQEVSLTLTPEGFLICISRDISARKADAQQLEATQSLLRSQYDNFPIPTYTWQHRDDNFYLINYNAAADLANDQQLANFIDKTTQTIYGADHELHHNIQLCFHNKRSFEAELQTKYRSHKQQQLFLRYLVITYVYIEPDMVMVHTQDLTERKRAETKLRQNQTFLRQVVDNDPNLIFVKDCQGQFVWANKAVADLYGTTVEELMGKTEALFNPHTDEIERFQQTERLVFNQKQSVLFEEEKITDHLGNENYFRIVKIPLNLYGDEDYTQVLGVASNITQQRQAKLKLEAALEQERELNHLKSRFVDTASHEFRTPLTVILGAADILQHYSTQLPPERRQKHLDNIQTNARRIEQLINDLLSMSRIESGKLRCDRQPTDVIKLCHMVIEDIKAGVGHDHDLQFFTKGEFDHPLIVDGNLLRHVLSNLLMNACKYSAAKSSVVLETTYDENGLSFAVQDKGIGIPAEDQAHLFESFYRASNIHTISGTGLGLNIVQEYVKLHGGTIHFISELDVGSTFFVHIPTV